MDSIWAILGLDPTEDVSAIKRAYAEKAKTCHPEEDPEGFLRLRKAYQAALAHGEEGEAPPAGPEEPEDEGWTLTNGPVLMDEGPNPYRDHEAAKAFLNLYTGKQRKNPQAWMDYFTSGAFLDVAWERRFAALLLEHVVRLEAEYPLNREFLNWLYVVYLFTVSWKVYLEPDGRERRDDVFQLERDAQFDGQEFIFEILKRGPKPKPFKGVEQAMRNSFAEYRALVRLAESGGWDEEKLKTAGKILEFYMISNFQDRNPGTTQRHPAGMRLIEHFFWRDGLPKELYRMVWQKLELKTAVMGRAKLLYGGLRERVLEQLPGIMEGELDIRRLNREFETYRQRVRALEETGRPEDWETAGEETKAFFARPDFRKALWDRRFAEEHMKYHVQWSGEHFSQEILAFYEGHPEAPCAKQLTVLMDGVLHRREIERWNQEDKNAPVPEGRPTLKDRPFLRHWLNTGFYHAQNRDTGNALLAYLNQELPYLPAWSWRFLEMDDNPVPVPRSVLCSLDEDRVEVCFHLRYMSFLLNGEPVYRPCLPWERVAALVDTDTFFFLLPLTTAIYDRYETVKKEILRRLPDTAAPEDGWEDIAGCLSDQVCGLPRPDAVGIVSEQDEEDGEDGEGEEDAAGLRPSSLPPESVLPFEIFAENAELLYVCVWFQQERILALYQQTFYGKEMVREGQYDAPDAGTAVTLARQLMEEQLFPKGLPMDALQTLPEAVYAQWDYRAICHDTFKPQWGKPVELLGEDVTREKLEDLLTQFGEGRLERLEWSWRTTLMEGERQGYEPLRSLVFLRSGGVYACLYFDDFRGESFALLERPETYGKEKVRFDPFRGGKLFRENIHRSFFTIRRQLRAIFKQVSWPNGVQYRAGIWTRAVNVDHGRTKYNLDKQLLGGFPMERACNCPDAPFYFSVYPNSAVFGRGEGGAETLKITELNRARLQKGLKAFIEGGFSKLRLTWGGEEGRRRHIVLLQDGGRFLMAWILEEKRTVEYHVADRWTYLDVEGKKYPKDTFLGRLTPAYLIHDLPALRNALDLLLANLDHPARVTDPMGEYAGEKPVKPRPYEALWAELVGEG